MSASSRKDTLKNAREWDAMMATGELFPERDPQAVRRIEAPVLLLSGQKSYPFLAPTGFPNVPAIVVVTPERALELAIQWAILSLLV